MKTDFPKLQNWKNCFIVLATQVSAALDDYLVFFEYKFLINPEMTEAPEDLVGLINGLKQKDSLALYEVFPRFFQRSFISYSDIRLGFDRRKDARLLDRVKSTYFGEKFSIVYDFNICLTGRSLDHKKIGRRQITASDEWCYFLPSQDLFFKGLLFEALQVFNYISQENQTTPSRFGKIWNKLYQFQNLAFDFDIKPLIVDELLEEEYDRFFVPRSSITLRMSNVNSIIDAANKFQLEFKSQRSDYCQSSKKNSKSNVIKAKETYGKIYKNAFEAYLGEIIESWTNQFILARIIARCEYCNSYIAYHRGKKYCSMISEGRKCGDQARDKRYYYKHHEKNLRVKRGWTSRTRKEIPDYR